MSKELEVLNIFLMSKTRVNIDMTI